MTMQMSTQRYEPLSLFGACCVLELAGGRVYIGWSRNLSNRLSEHWAGSGQPLEPSVHGVLSETVQA